MLSRQAGSCAMTGGMIDRDDDDRLLHAGGGAEWLPG